jgi:hypothetical protein
MPLQVIAVRGEIAETEIGQPPLDALADLSPYLAEPGPPEAQSWERPLQELHALLVVHHLLDRGRRTATFTLSSA